MSFLFLIPLPSLTYRFSLPQLFSLATYSLQTLNLAALSTEEEKLVFWVNVYHTLMLHGYAELGAPASTRTLAKFLCSTSYCIGGYTVSLNEIENAILRAPLSPPKSASSLPSGSIAHFSKKDPRHALRLSKPEPLLSAILNCGSESCPKIRILFLGTLGNDIATAAHQFFQSHMSVTMDRNDYHVHIPRVVGWYSSDFGKDKYHILITLLPYLSPSTSHVMELFNLLGNEKEIKKVKVKVEPKAYEWRFYCDLSVAFAQLESDLD